MVIIASMAGSSFSIPSHSDCGGSPTCSLILISVMTFMGAPRVRCGYANASYGRRRFSTWDQEKFPALSAGGPR
jgi:hypothetical protein